MLPLAILSAVGAIMIGETWVSARHESRLRSRGALEPSDDLFRVMRVAYPAAFVVLTAEGLVRGLPDASWWGPGLAIFIAAKVLKGWAMAALGERWTFRVLVLPGVPLVGTGPYRYVSHPNYLAVVGELVGMAALMGATWSALPVWAGFGWLLERRIRVEERALGAAASVAGCRQV